MTITAEALTDPDARLSHATQVRFTPAQYELLEELTGRTNGKLSRTIRDIVVCWAVEILGEEASLSGEAHPLDLELLVSQLSRLGDQEEAAGS